MNTLSRAKRLLPLLVSASVVITPVLAQGDGTGSGRERLAELERKQAELERQLEVLTDELGRQQLGDIFGPEAGSVVAPSILGPAASKIYGVENGLSIGGYGEFLYENFQGGDRDQFDALRTVLYFGYRFDEKWLLNTEFEFEHASTSTNPDGDDGSVSVEFGYLDYLHDPALNFRAGLVLIPMGFINRQHEPTTFYSAERTLTENRIIPTTWRENGVGIHGRASGFDYEAYVVTSLDGQGFTTSGLRGGRQKGNHSAAEDFSFVGTLGYEVTPELNVAASLYYGDQGQDSGIDAELTLYELHAEWRHAGWRARGLWAQAELDDGEEISALTPGFNPATDAVVADEMSGYYLELGYDLAASLDLGATSSLTPFVRWEEVDTQDSVASGFVSDPTRDVEILTIGVAWQPVDRIIFKLDYQDRDARSGGATDQWNFGFGYVF